MVWWTTRDAEGSAKVPGFGLRLLEESDDYRGFVDGLNRRR